MGDEDDVQRGASRTLVERPWMHPQERLIASRNRHLFSAMPCGSAIASRGQSDKSVTSQGRQVFPPLPPRPTRSNDISANHVSPKCWRQI